jgi:hypothetical protein
VSLRTKVWPVPIMLRLLLLLTFSSAFTLSAQTIEIKLIDGRNGHPIANSCVNVWVGNEQKDALAIPTDNDGVARLRLTDSDAEINTQNRWKQCGAFGVINPVVRFESSVTINAGYVLCQPQGTDYSWLALKNFPTKEILTEGVVTPNACGKHTAQREPGGVIVFVRPLSFWEKLKQ